MSMCAKWREALHEDAPNGISGSVCTKRFKTKGAPCTLNSTLCLYMDNNPTCKLSYMILILCVFHSHGTIQSNYRIILCGAQTKSHEWYPMAGREAILSSPKASITGLQWWHSGLSAFTMLGSICLSTAQLHPCCIHLAKCSFQLNIAWFCLNVLFCFFKFTYG